MQAPIPVGQTEAHASLARRAARRLKRHVQRLLGIRPPEEEQPRNKHLWSIGIYTGPSPLHLAPDGRIPNPVLTRDDVTDRPAGLVADPFLLLAGATWHMFFEVFDRRTRRGEIALATSADGAKWRYAQVVLAEPFHLSYPFTFEWMGAYYMVPETHETRTIRLYRAEQFPLQWKFVHTLMGGQRFVDATLVRHADRWWLFTETSPQMKHDTLRLYSAADLLGAWTEHPASPVVRNDPHAARPGGSLVSTPGGLIRYAQDCAPRYGTAVRAFEITTLNPREYVERPAAGNPLHVGSGSGWNESGMHHVDAHPLAPGRWIAAVDGWRAATSAEIYGER